MIKASPPPQACPEFYPRTAPATCALTLRLSRTCPPRCIKYPHIAHARAPAHCLYHKHLHTAPRCSLLSRLNHSHQCTCTLPLSQAPSHSASLQLTFALTSPNHLFTVPHYVLFPHGFAHRMSRFKKLRLTTSYPRIAFAGCTSLKLPRHGLRVKTSRKNFPG